MFLSQFTNRQNVSPLTVLPQLLNSSLFARFSSYRLLRAVPEQVQSGGLLNCLWYQLTNRKKCRVNFVFSHLVQGIPSQSKQRETCSFLIFSFLLMVLFTLVSWTKNIVLLIPHPFSCILCPIKGKLYWVNRTSSWCLFPSPGDHFCPVGDLRVVSQSRCLRVWKEHTC